MRNIAFALALLMLLSTPVFAEQNDMSDPSDVNDDSVVGWPFVIRPPDVNDDGVVDVRDAVIVMQHILEIKTITCEDKLQIADVNDDGVVDVRDVPIIISFILQLL